MGLFTRRAAPPPRRGRHPLVAAATPMAPTPEGEKPKKARHTSERQARAWSFFDEIGEVRFAAEFMGNAFSRLRLFPAVQPDPTQDPVPLDPEGDPEAGYTAAEAELALTAMAELWSPLGGQAEIQRRMGVNLFVPGELHLVGREWMGETKRWDVYSTDEVRGDSEGKYYLHAPGSTAKEPLADSMVLRIWRSHPRWSNEPDSPVLSSQEILEELLISTRSIQGDMLSRLSGPGMMFLPNSMRGGATRATDSEGDGQSVGIDPVTSDLIMVSSAAIADPASAASRVPVIQWMDDDLWRDMSADKLVTWDHTVDQIAAETRAELLRRFAVAIDLPAEVLTGIGSSNHWSAWFIGRETFQSHIEPAAMIMYDGLAAHYLQPALVAAGVADVGRFSVWGDASALVANPDQTENSKAAHAAYVISDDRHRRDLGYSDDDAPDDDEIARRVLLESARSGRQSTLGPAGPGNVSETPPELETSVRQPVLAAVSGPLAGLGSELAEMDAALLHSVHQMADAAMHRVLERANARLRSLALRDKSGTLRALLEQVPNVSLMVSPTLGPAQVDRLTAADDTELLDAAGFAAMLDRYEARVERVGAETVLAAQKAGVGLSDAEASRLADEYAAAREASRLVLAGALTGLASQLLFRPEPLGPPGEVDGSLVPVGSVRSALARAGGGGERASSMLTGDLVSSTLTRAGITFAAYRWRYGDPTFRTSPFEPHRRLNGVGFANPNDDVLAHVSGGWPNVSHYWPGDHAGCSCLVEWTNASVADRSQLPSA